MHLVFNTILDLNAIVFLIIIAAFARSSLTGKTFHDRIFLFMIYVSILMLSLDIFSRFDGNAGTVYPMLNHLSNMLIFLLNPVFPSLWVLYVSCLISSDGRPSRIVYYPLILISTVNIVLVIISQFTGWYYHIDNNNIYSRGTLFMIPVLMTLSLMGMGIVMTIIYRQKIGKKYFRSILFVSVPNIIAIFLQVFFYGYSFVLNSAALSMLIVYLGIQRRSACLDYLTGAGNRKMLDESMQEKINAANRKKSFAAIMIDLDGFKEINDSLGHDNGDDALDNATKIIRACIRSDDLLTRYGGDEFVLLLDNATQSRLDHVVERLKRGVDHFNRDSGAPYTLGFSMGYAVYNADERMPMHAFLKHLDSRMYEDKLSKRRHYSDSETNRFSPTSA